MSTEFQKEVQALVSIEELRVIDRCSAIEWSDLLVNSRGAKAFLVGVDLLSDEDVQWAADALLKLKTVCHRCAPLIVLWRRLSGAPAHKIQVPVVNFLLEQGAHHLIIEDCLSTPELGAIILQTAVLSITKLLQMADMQEEEQEPMVFQFAEMLEKETPSRMDEELPMHVVIGDVQDIRNCKETNTDRVLSAADFSMHPESIFAPCRSYHVPYDRADSAQESEVSNDFSPSPHHFPVSWPLRAHKPKHSSVHQDIRTKALAFMFTDCSSSDAGFPFKLPPGVAPPVLSSFLKLFVRLSRSTVESKRLAKSLVLGKSRDLEGFVVRRKIFMPPEPPSYDLLYKLAQSDGALEADSATGDITAKVSLVPRSRDHYPEWNENRRLRETGERHRSAAAVAYGLGIVGSSGLVILASESMEMNTVKVFVRGDVWQYDANPGSPEWECLHPLR